MQNNVKEYNENLNNFLNKNEEKILIVSNKINSIKNFTNKTTNPKQDQEIDTSDLFDDNSYDLEIIKKKYTNNMLSWSMLTKISDFNQWPLGCLGNFIENSLKPEVNTQNIAIEMKAFKNNKYEEKSDKKIIDSSKNLFNDKKIKKKVYIFDDIEITNTLDFQNFNLVLLIKDDGRGISSSEFNQILYSFSINEKKEFNFFKYGMSFKTSALRLCNSFLIISKTETEINIGLISKNLQNKIYSDFILTPVVNFNYEKDILISNNTFYLQTLNFILEEINFIFKNIENLFDYIKSFSNGTHLFLYDFKKISENNSENLNEPLKNYELYFDLENQDILFNYFDICIGDRNLIDCSLRTYLEYLFLNNSEEINLYLFNKKVSLINPLNCIYNVSKTNTEICRIKHNLKSDEKPCDAIAIDNQVYKGILFNGKYFENIIKESTYENIIIQSKNIFNGILFYSNNRLISRMDQNKFGEINFFVKKYEKLQKKIFNSNNENKDSNFFDISGYLELPNNFYYVLYNKSVK